jgi:RNA polymerase sigma-70 factor (ECF subfamily)
MGDPTAVPVDETDFESVAVPHLEAVAQFALSLTRDRADADDLVQETFLRAFRGWHTFRTGSDARRWLFTICRNAFLVTRRQRPVLVESDDGDVDAMPAVLAHAQAVEDGLGELFDLIDVRPAIERAIDSLPEPHHSILVLADLQSLSYEEVARILEIPIGTVRSRLFRARRMIQESLLAHANDAGIARPRARSPDLRSGDTSPLRLPSTRK